MSEITKILSAIEQGDFAASHRLLPLVYEELRRLAAAKLSKESNANSIQPTLLVHEAYLRLVDDKPNERKWNSKGHFFGAAAEARRRILIDHARRKQSQKRGGQWQKSSVG